MDDVFKNLQKQSQNCASNLIKWMQDSNLLPPNDEGDQKGKSLFENTDNDKLVDFEKFQRVITDLAIEKKKSFDDVANQLAEEGPKFIKAVEAGVKAFKDTMSKKSSDTGKAKGKADALRLSDDGLDGFRFCEDLQKQKQSSDKDTKHNTKDKKT